MSTHIVLGFHFDSSKIFLIALVILILFSSFKGITHAYLLQMSITRNKNLNPLLNLLINYISASSSTQILSIKGNCTFLFSNFLVICLCNSSINYILGIISFLINHCRPLKQVHKDKHHILRF